MKFRQLSSGWLQAVGSGTRLLNMEWYRMIQRHSIKAGAFCKWPRYWPLHQTQSNMGVLKVSVIAVALAALLGLAGQ